MRFDMLSVWSQWLLASQALLENAWDKDGLTGFGDHHDHHTRDDHDDHDTRDDHHDHDTHGMIMMVVTIWPGSHAALKGLKTSSFIHNLTLFHCFFFFC